ncbi:hypothetical protein CIT25_02790 [Mesorhizobium mediterraneum]|uniref:Transcriptional regulator n=1 Tax=Mesorhizobium mediterraneum TaxID=43617 RepID=A0AB36RGU1_9HYPH|nr:hypothetical protein CIT25_02790 [Mesorhizobium mediterraneum]
MDGGRNLLDAVGPALYGARWQSPLARDLGVTDRTMRNWVAQKHEVPDHVPRQLHRLLLERGSAVQSTIALVERHLHRAE